MIIDMIYQKNLEEKVKDYKSRIEKAVEYIKENKSYWEEWHYDGTDIDIENDINYILNILNGRSDE